MKPISYQDFIEGAIAAALKNSEAHGHIEFIDGARGDALKKYATDLALSRLSNFDAELVESANRTHDILAGAYRGALQRKTGEKDQAPIPAEEASRLASGDLMAVQAYVATTLPLTDIPPKGASFPALHEEFKQALQESLVESNAKYEFSEAKPRPYRSDLLEPMLLNRIPGIDASKEIAAARKKLQAAFTDVPKKDGGTIQEFEANLIVENAERVANEFLDGKIGKVIKK